jgi:hypothetical protein
MAVELLCNQMPIELLHFPFAALCKRRRIRTPLPPGSRCHLDPAATWIPLPPGSPPLASHRFRPFPTNPAHTPIAAMHANATRDSCRAVQSLTIRHPETSTPAPILPCRGGDLRRLFLVVDASCRRVLVTSHCSHIAPFSSREKPGSHVLMLSHPSRPDALDPLPEGVWCCGRHAYDCPDPVLPGMTSWIPRCRGRVSCTPP